MARAAPRQPGPPAGVIFGCNRSSEEESLNGLFGMSSGHWSLVKEIIPGTPCFLFNFNTKVSSAVVEVLPFRCGFFFGDSHMCQTVINTAALLHGLGVSRLVDLSSSTTQLSAGTSWRI